MLNTIQKILVLLSFSIFTIYSSHAQSNINNVHREAAKGLKLREIGPAVMGGRIADIAVNPNDKNTWYVAVGSGGLWKTINSGITWQPLFDAQPSYSIGCVTIDPNNPNVIWVGTGENVSGRHVAWGDGVYKSLDGGKSWQQMGLEKSEHIGKIIVDPRNSDIVFVAAEGPLWSSGGERGLYKSTNGGKTWELTLKIDKNTGVTDVEFDPSNPDILYAAAYQRRRKTWSFLAGGSESGIYKSTDNGATWRKLKNGLPSGEMGKIGLAVTKANPQIVYATIEAHDKEKGFYKSMDNGESWEKRNSYISGGTGPHYYQEIEASPTNPDLVYQMDVFLHVTRDGGKNFDYLGTGREKHSDNHALWIDPDNGKHLIAGSDGGLYETFDEGTTWRHFSNLPISQFYKLAIDNAEPFYNVVAGAQDLGTLLGPSRTTNSEGVRNQDWYVPLGADGYDCAFDPEDPNIVYMEIQNGLLYRLDRTTEEIIMIQPQPEPGDAPERYNWDAPVIVSPHDHKTLYFGSQRLWKSIDRGNSWKAISGDLTTNVNRYELKMMDNVPSIDALFDNGAMSQFATLTAISESPIKEGLLYTGSDDGLIQMSDDDGQTWIKIQNLPKVPDLSFINDVEASKHDENVVFAVADAHKIGDFNPYLFMSGNRGKSWQSISGDLPANTIVWVIKQDHIDPNLLFIGTETGIYYSPNKGTNWVKLNAGLPTISFRDLEIHERDNDLVGASFGRGIFVLDDYASLREAAKVSNTNTLFTVRDAWWYVSNVPMQAEGNPTAGSSKFSSPNPPFGALLTYFIADLPKTTKQERKEKEKELQKQKTDIPFPGWEKLKSESLEAEPEVLVLISDEKGNALRWLSGTAKEGVHRINWDLRMPAPNPINLTKPAFSPPWAGTPKGPMVAPGQYSAQLYLVDNGDLKPQGVAQQFEVKPTPNVKASINYEELATFTQKTADLSKRVGAAGNKLGEFNDKLRHIEEAIMQTSSLNPELFEQLKSLKIKSAKLREALYGDAIRSSKDEPNEPHVSNRIGSVIYGHWNTTQLPTETQKRSIELAEKELQEIMDEFIGFGDEISSFENELVKAGAPYTPGRNIE